jgi:hypothetical protein
MVWDAVRFKDLLGVLVVGLVATPPGASGALINQWIRGTCVPDKVTAQEGRCTVMVRVKLIVWLMVLCRSHRSPPPLWQKEVRKVIWIPL